MEPNLSGKGSILEVIGDANSSIVSFPVNKEVSKWKTGTELILAAVDNIPCLVEPIIPKTGIVIFGGSSDTGKSTILRQLVISIVSGVEDFLGWKLSAEYKRALFIATEDDKNAISFLLKKQAATIPPDKLKEIYYLFEYEPSTLVEECIEFVKHKPVDLIVVDCFADAFAGKLMDTNEVRLYMNSYKPLAKNCTVIFLHHTGKRTENYEPSKNNLLSGQGLESKARLVFELRLDHYVPHIRHLCITKANYLGAGFKNESYELVFDESNFIFTNSGKRRPFEELSKVQNDEGKGKYLKAKELKDQGKSYEEIAPLIGYEGKGSVSKLFSKAKARGWNMGGIDSVSKVETQESKSETPF